MYRVSKSQGLRVELRNGARSEANEEEALNGVFKDVEDMGMAEEEAREVRGGNGKTAVCHGG
jgi:predicted DNA-binding protein